MSDITVTFGQSMYTVEENNGIVQVSLILNIPSSAIISIEVLSTDESATGELKYFNMLTMHLYCVFFIVTKQVAITYMKL